MSELFDIQVNAQKEKNFWGSHKLLQAHKKCAVKMKERNKQTNKQTKKKKRRARKNVIDGRKPFIRRTQRTGENNLNKL